MWLWLCSIQLLAEFLATQFTSSVIHYQSVRSFTDFAHRTNCTSTKSTRLIFCTSVKTLMQISALCSWQNITLHLFLTSILICWLSVTLTLRQRSLGLAVKHDVDAGERSVAEQRGSQPRKQSPDSLRLIHTPQSTGHTHITVKATLKNTEKLKWNVFNHAVDWVTIDVNDCLCIHTTCLHRKEGHNKIEQKPLTKSSSTTLF